MTFLDRVLGRVAEPVAERAVPAARDVDLVGSLFQRPLGKGKAAGYLTSSEAVFACIRTRTALVSDVPLKFYHPGKERREVDSGPVVELFDYVNPFYTFPRLMTATESALCLWGEGFWIIEKDTRGRPREIWYAKPTQVFPVPDSDNFLAGYIYQTASGKQIPFGVDEVVWFRHHNPDDDYSGLSPLAAAKLAADVGTAAMISNRNLFAQGMQMAGFVMPKNGAQLTTEQMKELETLLHRRFSGLDKAHRWGVFKAEFDLKQLGVTPKDAEWLGAMSFSLQAVCRAFGVPDELVGGGKRTYENLDQALTSIWTLTCKPELKLIAAEIREQLLPMFKGSESKLRVEFDLSGIGALHNEQAAVWSRVTSAFAVGLLGERTAHRILGVEYDPDDRRLLSMAQNIVPMDAPDSVPVPALPDPEVS